MPVMRLLVCLLIVGVSVAQNSPSPASQQQGDAVPLTAETIMARVAANQDRSEILRKEYIYKQHVHIVTHKPKGRLMREEATDYDVVPMPDGTQKQLKQLTGRYWTKGKYVDFNGEPTPDAESLDGQLVHEFRDDLANENPKTGSAMIYFR